MSTRRRRARQPSLRLQYLPEIETLRQIAIALGLAVEAWPGPSEFTVRRSRLAGCSGWARPWRIHVSVGYGARRADILHVIIHEFAHHLTWPKDPIVAAIYDFHGSQFREVLRKLVRARFEGIEAWDESGQCVEEEDQIVVAISKWLVSHG